MEQRDDYEARFGGIGRLFGQAALARLADARVCVVGVGGVGSWTVEALARSGVGAITMVDLDDICINNANRQLHTLDGTVGQQKVAVMAERVRRINPGCEVEAVVDFFTPSSADALLARRFDHVVDAIDHVANKGLLIARCVAAGVPVVTVGGAGGRSDPSSVVVSDLNHSSRDGLLRRVRKLLRREHDFPPDHRVRWGVACVYSAEPAALPGGDGEVCEQGAAGASLRLDCTTGFGTASFVTGTFGFAAAAVVVRALARGG